MSSTSQLGAQNWDVKFIENGSVVATYDSEAKAKRSCASKNKLYKREAFIVERA